MKVRFGPRFLRGDGDGPAAGARLDDLLASIASAVEAQHRLNVRAYPREGPPRRWDQPVPHEPSLFEAEVSLLTFLEGILEHLVRIRHGDLEGLRWLHATCASLEANVAACVEARTPNPSGFTDVPRDVVEAAMRLRDLLALAPVSLFEPVDEEGIRAELGPEGVAPRSFARLVATYDRVGTTAFGSKASWAERGRTSELADAWERGFPPPQG